MINKKNPGTPTCALDDEQKWSTNYKKVVDKSETEEFTLTHGGHRVTLSAQMMNRSGPQLQKVVHKSEGIQQGRHRRRARLPRKVSTACAHADERCDLGCALPINFERKSLSQYPRTPNAPQKRLRG